MQLFSFFLQNVLFYYSRTLKGDKQMNVGIDQISFYVPQMYLDMTDLAQARNVDPNKYLIGIGQEKMAINPQSQDIITLGANAAEKILTDQDKEQIDLVIVGTESSIDESKASAVILHRLLGIQPYARAIEVKEACYAGTAALQMAVNHVRLHPESKALVIATDIARYGLNSGGEPTQGAGAVAMLITKEPRILVIEEKTLALTKDVYDFWRPTNQKYPLVDGPLSNSTYINAFSDVFTAYNQKYQQSLTDYKALLFHIPYTKMGRKALNHLLENVDEALAKEFIDNYELSICYSRQIGNLYTGSLYLGLISYLDHVATLKPEDTIGLFSYGSGMVGEFFQAHVVEGYQEHLHTTQNQETLNKRHRLTFTEYETCLNEHLDPSIDQVFEDETRFSIEKVENHIRYYKN